MTQPADDAAELRALRDWLVQGFTPGWQELHLQLRPLRDEVRIRVVEVRDGTRRARLGTLTESSPAYRHARTLQDDRARPGAGTWIEATISARAGDDPEAPVSTTAGFTTVTEPQAWQEGGQLAATDLVHHLTRFPRRGAAVPAWMAERITAAGLDVPAGEPVTRPSPEDEISAPAVLDVRVDRDGLPGAPAGHQRATLRLGGSLDLVAVLETVGVPVPFADGRGSWIVRHGAERVDGDVLAVVAQEGVPSSELPAGVAVHLMTDARPVDLLDDDGVLALFYCSVPGELESVLDAARLGVVSLPPRPSGTPDNPQVREAVAAFGEETGRRPVLHVLRQALGGRLIVDATGSAAPAPDEQRTNLRLTTITAPDGTRGIAAFTSNAAMARFRRKQAEDSGEQLPDRLTGLAQPGVRTLELFQGNEDLQWLIIDPAGPSCALGRKEVAFALAAPSNREVKDLLRDEPGVQEVFDALRAPDGHLFLAQTEVDGTAGPVLLRDKDDGEPVLPAFTSPAEVAAYNPDFASRRFPVAAVLHLVLANRAKALQLNPSGPSIALSGAQVWHFLGRPELPPSPPRSAPGPA